MITRRLFSKRALAATLFGTLVKPAVAKEQLIYWPHDPIYAGDVVKIRGWYLIHCCPHVEWILKPPSELPPRGDKVASSWVQYTVRRREPYWLILCRNNQEYRLDVSELRIFLAGGALVNLSDLERKSA